MLAVGSHIQRREARLRRTNLRIRRIRANSRNWSALRTPSKLAKDCSRRQRSGPTPGAANGMPLNTRTVLSIPETPVLYDLAVGITFLGAP